MALTYPNKPENWTPSETEPRGPQTSFVCGECWTLFTTKEPVVSLFCIMPCGACLKKLEKDPICQRCKETEKEGTHHHVEPGRIKGVEGGHFFIAERYR